MDLSINLKIRIRMKIKIDTQIHTQKLKLFKSILNYHIRNLQETQTQT